MKVRRESIPENCQFESIPNGGTFYINNPITPCIKIATIFSDNVEDDDLAVIYDFQLVLDTVSRGVYMELDTGKINQIDNNMTVNIINGEFVY